MISLPSSEDLIIPIVMVKVDNDNVIFDDDDVVVVDDKENNTIIITNNTILTVWKAFLHRLLQNLSLSSPLAYSSSQEHPNNPLQA